MNLLYGIAGGIAAYKAPEVVRALMKDGHVVRCVLTRSARRLVSAEALAAVSRQPVATSMWRRDGAMPHIDLPRWCDALLVAPLTADCLARFALGLADDLLTTLFIALEPGKRVVLAPAMNTQMWGKPIVQAHVATLRGWGARVVEPVPGELACGETGVGAMASPEVLAQAMA
ncbi:MAG TPA: flavoprotein [Planctomycetota bacterium]|nr:flavoprotein [Planctomycetota bacterium]